MHIPGSSTGCSDSSGREIGIGWPSVSRGCDSRSAAASALLADPIVAVGAMAPLLRSFQLKGSVLLIVWPQMAVCAGIAVFATIMRAWVGEEGYIIKDVKGHATLGTALAFLNVFRSNLSYGRYWDGRGQLGVLVKSGRELMRLVVTYSKIPEDEKEEAVRPPHASCESGTVRALV